jgi:hypothetical protein
MVITEVPTINAATVGVRVVTTGYRLFEEIGGTDYAVVRFRWSAYAQRDTFDQASFALKAGSQQIAVGLVTDQFLGGVFSQEPRLLLPTDRTYPGIP